MILCVAENFMQLLSSESGYFNAHVCCVWFCFLDLFRVPFAILNRWSRRKRGMASTPLFIIPEFFLHFPNELSYGYLRFEGNGKIPLGR